MKLISKTLKYGIFLLCLMIGSCTSRQSQRLQDTDAVIEIIIDHRASAMVQLAAKELQYHWEKMTGYLPLITNARKSKTVKAFYIGESSYTRQIKHKNKALLKDDGFVIESIADGIILIGNDEKYIPKEPYSRFRKDGKRVNKEWDKITNQPSDNPYGMLFKAYNKELDIWESDGKGSLNAVYHFLKSLGVRWYLPGELGEEIPKLTKIDLSGFELKVKPDFKIRQLGFYSRKFFNSPKQDILWYLRLGLSNGYNLIGDGPFGHGLVGVISRKEYRRNNVEDFGIYNNKRDTTSRNRGRPCLSSGSLFKNHVDYLRTLFDTYDIPIASVMPPDAYSYVCECNKCHHKGTPERGRQGQISDYVWDYVNRIGKELEKSHPNKKLSCFAYGAYLLPPKNIKELNYNIQVGICKTRKNYNDENVKKKYYQIINDWLKLTDNKLIFWDYYLSNRPSNNPYFGYPAIFPSLIAEDLRRYKDVLLGEYVEVYRSFGSANPMTELGFSHFNIYITAALYWNVDQDIELEKEEYFKKYFGPAANEMKKFYVIAERNWASSIKEERVMLKLFSLLNEAQQRVGKGKYKERLKLISDYLELVKQKDKSKK